MTSRDIERTSVVPLSEAVSKRRRELGYTKSDLARRARTTRSTIHEIENGTRKHLQAATYNGLDEALRWTPGTLEAMTSEKVVTYEAKRSSAQSDDRLFAMMAMELLREVRQEVADLRRLYEEQEKRSNQSGGSRPRRALSA